ncbi:MAG: hypothetical protein ACLSHM_01310 [Vescimonas sp.]
MTAFYNNTSLPALPVILWLGRALVSGLAVWLLVGAACPVPGKGPGELGLCDPVNGARYEIYHWENVIGRAKRSDIRINFPSVSHQSRHFVRTRPGHGGSTR